MRYIEAKILQANPELDLNSLISNENKSIISPIPRGYTKLGHPYYEESNSLSYLPEGRNGQPVIKDHALPNEQGGRNEIGLIKDLEGISYLLAKKLANNYVNSDSLYKKYNFNLLARAFQLEDLDEVAKKYNWDIKVLKKLKIFKADTELFSIPIINNGVALSVASYFPNKKNGKWMYSKGTHGQFIINYDNWLYDQRPTIIAEGAKDMLTLLSLGYNAISLTNGATAIPEFYPNAFKNLGTNESKEIYIIYDNDKAGKDGAKNLAAWLWEQKVKKIKIIDISDICNKQGEDIWDYFNTYKQTKENLDKLILDTNWFAQEEYLNITQNKYAFKPIAEAKKKENINKVFQTDIEVVGKSTSSEWIIPESVDVKYIFSGYGNKRPQTVSLEIDEKDMFGLMKPIGIQKEKILNTKLKYYTTHKKDFVIEEFNKTSEEYIFFYEVTQAQPLYSEVTEETGSTEYFPCYSIGKQLKENRRYRITYTITANPDGKSDSLIIIKDATEIKLVEENFQLTKEEWNELKKFQQKENETIDEAVDRRLQEINYYIGYDLHKQKNLWLTSELTFHSVYEYQSAAGEAKTGMLVTMIFGDPSMGKSHIYKYLADLYNRGYHLPANNTTEIALVGGAVTREGGQKITRSGIIATQHKGLIVMEEFTHYNKLLLKLTDLITSGRANVTRIGGNVNYYAKLRWLFISNTTTGKKIKEEKHALVPLSKLIPTLEWYRRYDIALAVSIDTILNNDGSMNAPPDAAIVKAKKTDFDKSLYRLKMRWVWSRTKEHAIITDELKNYMFAYANQWTKDYGKKVDVVGDNQRVIYDKICKIAFAIATMLFSTDDGINIKLTKEHADWAYNFLVSIYDNDVFKLKNYLKDVNKFTVSTDDDVECLQKLYSINADYADFLETLASQDDGESYASRDLQQWYFGDDFKETHYTFKYLFRELLRSKFLRPKSRGFVITDKFLNAYKELDTSLIPEKIEDEEIKYDF